MSQKRATVQEAIQAFESALEELKKLPGDMVVDSVVDEGGYTDCPLELKSISFQIQPMDEEEHQEMIDEGDIPADSPRPVCIVSNLISE